MFRRFGLHDARSKIDARRRAQSAQERVNAARRLQIQQRRFPGNNQTTIRNNQDLSLKLANSRRNRSGNETQKKKPIEKRLSNFTVVTSVDNDESDLAPIQAIVRNPNRNLRNFSLSIPNDKAIQGISPQRRLLGTKRTIYTVGNTSPMKRRRSELEDDDMSMRTSRFGRLQTSGLGMVRTASQRAQSRDSSSLSSFDRRSRGTMIADMEETTQRPIRVSIQNRLSSLPSRTSGKNTVDGYRVLVTQLSDTVTSEDLVELFESVGALKEAYLIEPGIGEAIFVRKADAERAIKEFHNRELDGIPMHCKLVPFVASTASRREPIVSQSSTLTSRFRGAETLAEIPAKGAGAMRKTHTLNPDKEVISSVLFGNQTKRNDVTFTVKVSSHQSLGCTF